MHSRSDVSRVDFVTAQTCTTAFTGPIGTNTPSDNLNTTRPFSVQPLLGYNHVSITINVTGGAVTGFNVAVQVTDFAASEYDIFGSGVPWATTANTFALTGAGTATLNIPNIGAKWLRLNVTSVTGGTAVVTAAITCRANSR